MASLSLSLSLSLAQSMGYTSPTVASMKCYFPLAMMSTCTRCWWAMAAHCLRRHCTWYATTPSTPGTWAGTTTTSATKRILPWWNGSKSSSEWWLLWCCYGVAMWCGPMYSLSCWSTWEECECGEMRDRFHLFWCVLSLLLQQIWPLLQGRCGTWHW